MCPNLGTIGSKSFVEDTDTLVDKVVSYLEPMTLEDIVDVLFIANLRKFLKGSGHIC